MGPTITSDETRGSYWRFLLLLICQILAWTFELLHLNHVQSGTLAPVLILEGPWETLVLEYCQCDRLGAFRLNTV